MRLCDAQDVLLQEEEDSSDVWELVVSGLLTVLSYRAVVSNDDHTCIHLMYVASELLISVISKTLVVCSAFELLVLRVTSIRKHWQLRRQSGNKRMLKLADISAGIIGVPKTLFQAVLMTVNDDGLLVPQPIERLG